jgi:hypothetical protein
MDRRRLEMAHLKYAMLNVCSWYSELSINQVGITASKVDDTILQFSSIYYSCFSSKYSRKVISITILLYMYMYVAVPGRNQRLFLIIITQEC